MNITSLNTERFGVVGDFYGEKDTENCCPECGQDLCDEWEWEYYEGVLVKKITGEYCGCGYRRIFEED